MHPMILQAYIVTVLLAGLLLIAVIAKLFFSEFPTDKTDKRSFISRWVAYPKYKMCVEKRARGFLTFLYYTQIVLLVVVIIVLIVGDYSM
ncbi:hypothetical protein [Terasakiella sp.]|uniref:hypothetical protein n=1 Tax=Terasakiella sp. TaxID=2034861 RepID=UPI003AA963C6